MGPSKVVLVTASYDRNIKFWDALGGLCQRTVPFPESVVNCMCMTPDRQGLLAAGQRHVRLFDVNGNITKPKWSVDTSQTSITAIGYQTDGQWFYTAAEDGTIKLWDVREKGNTARRTYDCKAAVNTACLHPNQAELVCGDQNGVLRIWDLANDKSMQQIAMRPDTSIRSISINDTGDTAAVASNCGEVYVMRVLRGNEPADELQGEGGEGEQKEGTDQGISTGPVNRMAVDHMFRAHNRYILKCLFSPNQKLLATCSADSTINLWHTNKADGQAPASSSQGNPGGGSQAASQQGGVKPWSLDRTLQGHTRWVWDCSFSVDSAFLVSVSSDQTGHLWNVNKGEIMRNYSNHQKPVTCVVLDDSSNGR